MKTRIAVMMVLGILPLLQACDWRASDRDKAVVRGEVSYLQRIALPEDAVLTVQLEDVSHHDMPATILAEQKIALDGRQVPVEFTLHYDPAELDQTHRYAIAARIEDKQGLRFITTELHGVSLADPDVEMMIMVDPVVPANGAEGGGPLFNCQGNEPFWNLELSPGLAELKQLGETDSGRRFKGGYVALFGPDGGAFYEWQGIAGADDRIKLRVLPGQCLDSMASEEEGGFFDHSGSVHVGDEQLSGCCRMTSVVMPQPTEFYACENGEDVAAVYETEGNSSRLLLQLEDGRELVLPEQISASSARFSDGDTVFWIKSNHAMLELDGSAASHCEIQVE